MPEKVTRIDTIAFNHGTDRTMDVRQMILTDSPTSNLEMLSRAFKKTQNRNCNNEYLNLQLLNEGYRKIFMARQNYINKRLFSHNLSLPC